MIGRLNWLIVILFFSNLSARTIGIISDSRFCGEREVGAKIERAAQSLGWEVYLDENRGVELSERDDLDWVVSILPNLTNLNLKCPVYQTIFHPFNYLSREGILLPEYEAFDGFLLTVSKGEQFDANFEKNSYEWFWTRFYPSTQRIEYQEIKRHELVTTIAVWGNRKRDTKFKELYRLLDSGHITKFYGQEKPKSFSFYSYCGPIPFDGVSMLQAYQKHGIVLVLHSDVHIANHIPSGRIFEAAASSSVIISDQNPFVKKYFGDSVFYVNTNKSAANIYSDIQAIVTKIRRNPALASSMAKKSHSIFLKEFAMEDQLLEVDRHFLEVLQFFPRM